MASSFDQEALRDFAKPGNIRQQWNSARLLMAARQMQAAASQPEFQQGIQEIASFCTEAEGLDQLLAIALMMRVSELIKGNVRTFAAEVFKKALNSPPDPLWSIGEAKDLPPEAKSSEIRENVALALTYASGPWVLQYLIDGLAREDRSARCRLELCRQLAIREPRLTRWIEMLNAQPWSDIWKSESPDRAGKCRDLSVAMADTIRGDRNAVTVDEGSGPAISSMIQKLIPMSNRSGRPPKLEEAAVAVVELLDEVLATEFVLITDPDAYAPLVLIWRWWQPSSYPKQLSRSLSGIVRKLTSAIRLRARMGQQSETLRSRLAQAVASEKVAAEVLAHIAANEVGLESAIDDWLRGLRREDSTTSSAVSDLLSKSGNQEFAAAVALLLLDCLEASTAESQSTDSNLAVELRRLCARIQALAIDLGLVVSGELGEIVEFSSAAHRTPDGTTPAEPFVKIIRPMVIRRRNDGSMDVVEPARVVQSR